MYRTTNCSECQEVFDQHLEQFSFPVASWLSNPKNIALKSGGNIGLAEYKDDNHYWVHFCFTEARGQKALVLAQRMLTTLYNNYGFKWIIGPVSVGNKKAAWVVRQLGFKSAGLEETNRGLFEIFFLTEQAIKDKLNG